MGVIYLSFVKNGLYNYIEITFILYVTTFPVFTICLYSVNTQTLKVSINKLTSFMYTVISILLHYMCRCVHVFLPAPDMI